jgi:lysozyme
MEINVKGIALICEFEGCRTEAYQDAGGVWTIGYGHTSVAGPPTVGPGVTITRDEALEILTRDLETFCVGVKSAITATLSDNQFSALVSFAYNIGLGNFLSSSVLKSVNTYRFEQVPADLALWVKVRGKVLPGLIRRRAAEAALFLSGDPTASFSAADSQLASNRNTAEAGRGIEPLSESARRSSHINLAAVLSAAGGVLSSAAHHLENWLGRHASLALEVTAVLVVVLASLWIIHKHRQRATQHH